MSGNYTVPGAAPAGAAPASGYYSRPDLWTDAQKHQDDVEASYLRLKHLEGGLQTQTKNIEGMTNSLRFLQRRFQLAEKAGDTAQMESIKLHYDEIYSQLRRADLAYAKSYRDYKQAYSGYEAAWNVQNTYMTAQEEAEKQWRSTIRDSVTVGAELQQVQEQLRKLTQQDSTGRILTGLGNWAQNVLASSSNPGVAGQTYTPQNAQQIAELEAREKLLKEEYQWGLQFEDEALRNSEEFKTLSRQGLEKWQQMRAQQAQLKGKSALEHNAAAYAAANENPFVTAFNQVVQQYREDDSYQQPNEKWSQEQLDRFGYLLMTETAKAWEYAEQVNNQISQEKAQEQKDAIAQKATASGWAGVGHTIGALATAPLALADVMDNLAEFAGRGTVTSKDSLTPYDYSQAVVGGISKKLNEAGTIDNSVPVIGGKGWGDLYSIGFSVAQSLIAGKVTKVAGTGALTLLQFMGQGAAAGVDSGLESGASGTRAMAYGLISGAAEGFAEQIGVDNLMKLGSARTFKGFVKNLLKQSAAEGIEETVTAVLDSAADRIILGENSTFRKAVAEYEQSMSHEDAVRLAWTETIGGIVFDGLSGAISGGLGAGVTTTGANVVESIRDHRQAKPTATESVPQGAAEVPTEEAPATFQEEVQRQVAENMGGGKAAQGATAQLAAPTVQVSQDVWQQGQRLAQITGRNIKFYEGKASENGFFDPKTGEIWVNAKGGDPLAQVFCHELTHSIEQAGVYEKLSSLVLNRMQDTGMDLDTAREAKRQQYQRQGRPLPTQAAVDQELVAEYVSKYLLTNEQQIVSLVQQDRSLGQKIHDFFDRLLAKLGNKNAQERAFLSRTKNIYAKALRQTQAADMGAAGTVQTEAAQPTGESDADVAGDDFLDNLDAQLAAGEITEEEYDGIREEYERWQEEQYTAGERKYSLASNAKAELHKALYDLKYRDDVRLRDETPAIMLGHKGVKNLPMAMKASHIRENIFTEDEARALGLRVDDDIHYHGLGEEFFLQVIDGLDNVKEAYRGTKNASDPTRREDYFLLVSEFTDEAGNTVNVPVYINRHSQVNRVFLETNKISTVYGKTALRDYIMMQVKNGNLVRIKRKSTESSERAAHMAAGYRNDASSEMIADDHREVNRQFSLADDSQADAGYLDAVNRGDMAAAQKMVDEAAKAAGYTIMAYHGTSGEFTTFQRGNKRTRGSLNFGGGFYFSPSRSFAENYTTTGRVIEGYLKLENPYEVFGTRFDRSDLEAIAKKAGQEVTIENVTQILQQMGYDGIIAKDYNGTTNPVNQYVIFDANQVKSADPVTYDDEGKVIPLSERFNSGSNDIRYSLADEVEAETGEKQLGVAGKGKMPLSEFMGQYTQEKAEPWRQGSIVDDETVRQTQKAGYPVIDGVQIIPFVTWVHCTDPIPGTDKQRNNYGLVTGIGADGKLLVSFRNKGAKADTDTDADQTPSKKDNVAIATEYLTPVRGKYQMTQAEWESLENAMPEEADNMDLSDEERAEIDELLSRATASEETEAEQECIPIQRDALPAKAAGLLQQAERKLLWDISDRLGVPKLAGREYLTPIIQQMADEYLEKGRISPETRQLLFEQAYSQAVVVDAEFYEQYKHIKDHLRTTPVTISDRDKLDIADFNDFRKRAFNTLKIVNEGGLPVDTAYQELNSMAPELFPESITHPADQLVRMYDAARSIQVTEKTLQEYYGDEEPEHRKWARNDFEEAITKAAGKLWEVKRFAEEKLAKEKEPAPATEQEAMEAYKKLKQARRDYEKVSAKNLLTESDQMQVGRLLKHEILPEHLKEGKDNVKGILAVFQAKQEYERLCKLVAEYKRHLRGKARAEADELLKTANSWKDKKVGIAYSRETMERNVMDIIEDKALAQQVIDKYFAPVHTAEAASTRFKQDYRDRVRSMNISRKVQKGNLVSEAYAVQLLGEAQDNLRMLENARGRIKQRDGKNRHEWQAVIDALWAENPLLNREKIEWAVREFRFIYDKLFQQMNQVRVANGYEPVNYRQGYFPHFQAGDSDSILAQFGRALGIDTRIDVLPTTINGMTHAFKPGIQWFGNAQERLGFETAYDAVEGFDKYIEGVANVIHHTRNIQNLRAFASQIRYRTSDEGIRNQVDEIYQRQGLTDEEKQQLITEIYAHGKFTLSGFVAELDEYTNLLAGKKSRYDRAIEAAMGRKAYSVLKAWESRVAANMIAGNLTSALTNFIPWTQAGAQVGYIRLLRGVEQTLRATRSDDGFAGGSTFLTNRRGVDPLVQTWAQKASGIASKPMELIDGLVSESIVRAAYEQNRQQGLSEAEAMAQADAFAAGVMADRSKGSTPTLFHSTNPLMKAFTQFQLEVNNQFSEVFKDIPRRYRDKKLRELVWVLLKYFLGAWLYNWLYEKLIGRRPALDPIGMLCQFGEDWKEDGLGTAGANLASDALGQLPFASGLTLIGVETDGGRLPASSAVMDLTAIWKAATTEGWSAKKRWKEVQDELNKLAYVVPPFGGNQVGKLYKGLKAYFQGGSYSVDAAGNEVLQYPVYKDNPGDAFASFVKATILGKSALGTAQEWVDKGFNSLGAKQTAAYQDMLEAGVSDREAYELIRQISDAKETDTMKKAAVQRDVLRKSQVSGDGKAIAYYGLMASEKEWAIMDRLADMGADAGAVTDALMDMADVRAKDGSKQADVLAVISKAVLTDEEKAVLVGSVIGTEMLTEEGNLTQYAKFDYAVQNGMGVDQYIRYRASSASIDDYLELRDAGATVEDAMEAAMALQELKDSVEDPTTVQKWKAVMAGVTDPERQMISLSVVMTDSQYAKLTTARGFGVSPADFVSANEKIAKYDRDGNGRLTQAEVTQGISNLRLTMQQKAVLWQLITGSSSAKNNPYSQAIGERVIAALEKAKAEGQKPGHSFQDEIMRQIMANMGK